MSAADSLPDLYMCSDIRDVQLSGFSSRKKAYLILQMETVGCSGMLLKDLQTAGRYIQETIISTYTYKNGCVYVYVRA
jgi:hypothetical protein